LIGFGAGAQAQKKKTAIRTGRQNRKGLAGHRRRPSQTAAARPHFLQDRGFRHDSIPFGIKGISMMGDKTGAYTAPGQRR